MRAISTRNAARICRQCLASARKAPLPQARTATAIINAASDHRLPAERRFTHSAAEAAQPSSPSPPRTLYSFFPDTLPDGPPPSGHFPINRRSLRSEFLRLQSRYHPDLHPSSSKPQAEATSAAINEAYKTLLNPLLRAQYLLSLQGVDVANDETLKVEEPELLMVVLEAHETIEEAASPADLESLTAENEERIARSEEVLEGAFREHDIDRAKREAVRLRYWVNVRQAVSDWEEGKPAILHH
jgi:molecular chaperone HscB